MLVVNRKVVPCDVYAATPRRAQVTAHLVAYLTLGAPDERI